MRRAWVIVGALGLATLATAGMPPLPVEVAPAVRGPVWSVLPTVGTVRALREVKVGSKLAERVAELSVEEGDPVKQGQTVCTLDTTDTKLRILEAEAKLGEATATLKRLEAGTRAQLIQQAEATVAEQKAQLKKLKLDAARIQKLFERGVTSDAERDAAVADCETAEAKLQRVEAALSLAKEGIRAEEIAEAKATVALREAEVALAKQREADSVIVSPVDGYVVRKHVEKGEWTQIGATVVDLIDTSVLRVHTRVTETQIRRITDTQRAEVRLDALPGIKLEATVHRIIPQADAKSRSFPVQLNLKDTSGHARAGMFCRVSFLLDERPNVLLVPEDALIFRGGMAMVFKATPMPPMPPGGAPGGGPPKGDGAGTKTQDGPPGGPPGGMPPMAGPMMVASRAIVATGARQEGKIEITRVVNGTLDAGDLVVVVGSENMREGAMMIVVGGLPEKPKGGPPTATGPAKTPPKSAETRADERKDPQPR